MNTNVQDYVRRYVERAGKERILLYLFLLLCSGGFVALDAFAGIKYVDTYEEFYVSFFVQCGMYVCGVGLLGLCILLLLEGGRLVMAKDKLYKIPTDILVFAWFAVYGIMMNMARNMVYSALTYYQGGDGYFKNVPFIYEVFITFVTGVITVPFILLLANLLIIFVLQLKEGSFKEHLWLRKPCGAVKTWASAKRKRHIQRRQIRNGYECLRRNRRIERVFWCFEIGIIAALFIFSCYLMSDYGDEEGILLMGVTLVCGMHAVLASRHFGHGRSMADLFQMIDELGSGGERMINPVGENSVYYPVARQLCNIQEKVEESASAQVKSERMKVDLITNVSHDLKTPLTSVISYVDLLSKEDLPPEAADYVAILKKKSARLESMIHNVFDIAKATSGNATLELTTLHMNKLVEQTLADMQDVVEDSGFILRKQMTKEDTAFIGDSGKLYRVCQNIIENALKYSLSGSRIFIRTLCDDNVVTLQIVNTSAYEMTFDEESIMERFTRGDDSRTTEGNGLGLSIAKSFTEACGGTFAIFVEGDQFKAQVQFPRNKKKPADTDETAQTV